MNLLGLLFGCSRHRVGAAALLLALGACSDDGVPQGSGAGDTDAAGTSSASSPAETGGDPSAVTTADASTNPSATTDPSGPSDTDDTGPAPTSGGSSGDVTASDGSSGTATDSGTDSGGGDVECVEDADCQIIDDCCTCDAIPAGDEPPECDVSECFAPTCAVEGAGAPLTAECRLGTCVVPEVDCNQNEVVCNALPPKCGEGSLPTVAEGCWTGECAAAEHCNFVPSCDDCGDDEVCVQNVDTGAGSFRCEPLPTACEGEPSCDCMDAACEDPYDACGEGKGDAGLICGCPTC